MCKHVIAIDYEKKNRGTKDGPGNDKNKLFYRATLVVADLGWVDLNFDIPLSAKFCWGSWEFGRTGRVARQDDGT